MIDPLRAKKGFTVHGRAPLNAEPALDRLGLDFLTPHRDFYVRSHGAIPELDAASHVLRVDGLVSTPLALTLDDLRDRFAPREIVALLQCAGNRRADLQGVAATSGDPWAGGAVGNALWSGVALADVLRAAGLPERDGARDVHVALTSHDEVREGDRTFRFGVSIPLAKALSGEVLLADRMNGEPLAPEHGHPLRAIVPGYAGVRSAKWLASVTVREGPADTPIQREDYKLLPSHVTAETVDWSRGMTIDAMPVNAAILEPGAGAMLPAGRCCVRGYAVASGPASRVDVSTDGGRTWRQADLDVRDDHPRTWTLWRTEVDLPAGEHELVARAWDRAGQTQPAAPEEVWNFKGYLCTAWHRVRVRAR